MEVVGVESPGAAGPGEVLVAPEAVGLCGSDFHYFLGDIGTIEDPSTLYPRIQGHEAAGTIVEVGADCSDQLAVGMCVAIWPVGSCGHCYPCRIGRGNACVRISLTGIHTDGALQERLVLPSSQVFPVGDLDPALSALIEPVSIAVRSVARGRVAAGEQVVILGRGRSGRLLLWPRSTGVRRCCSSTRSKPTRAGEGVPPTFCTPVAASISRPRSRSGRMVTGRGRDRGDGRASARADGDERVAPAGRVVVVGLHTSPRLCGSATCRSGSST